MHIHIVTKGDTLWKIARSYNVSFEELKKLNAHLANPEYIVPGMKIFIPETKKMESINHPFSEHRPMNKKSEMKEEIHIQHHPGTHPSFQPVQPIQQAHPVHPKQQMHPVHPTHSVHPKQQMHPVHPTHSVHPKEQMHPVHPVPPKQQMRPVPIPIPVPIKSIQPQPMPVPELDMTQSPGGWRLIESTSIHINIHNDNREVELTTPVAPIPTPPVAPIVPAPAPPVQQAPPPVMEEATPIFPQMYPCEPCEPCDPCQQMQPFPFMHPHMMHPHMMHPHPHMHPHMQQQMQMHGHGGMPCVQVCYVPVYPCPPFQPF